MKSGKKKMHAICLLGKSLVALLQNLRPLEARDSRSEVVTKAWGTLAALACRNVPTGACVQMNYNSCGGTGTCQYAECQDGAWVCTPESNCSGQKFPHADCGPPPTGRECWSKTLGRHVPDGECVQMPYEACGSGTCSWAVCDDGAWSCTGQSSCGGVQHGHANCGGSTSDNNSGGSNGGGS